MAITYPIVADHPNGDEALNVAPGGPTVVPIPGGMPPVVPVPTAKNSAPPLYFGNFHKTLPHDALGEVDRGSYQGFSAICRSAPPTYGDFEMVAASNDPAAPLAAQKSANLINPQAGRATTDGLMPEPAEIVVPPPPGVQSLSTAAEMVELFWMAHLRDVPLDELAKPHVVVPAIEDMTAAFTAALGDGSPAGTGQRLELGTDLPDYAGGLDLSAQTLFRLGLKDECLGPLVSQFLLHDINYGAQLIQQTQIPYRSGRDYLTDFKSWLHTQNTGRDFDGDGYAQDNDFEKDMSHFEPPLPDGSLPRYRIRTMRDLARFVNRDALHQAYFNAALLLNNWGAKLTDGNPYLAPHAAHYKRQDSFGTLGGPNLLALVSEVASRALRVAWRQKWIVHRRLRPEAYGGLMQVQSLGRRNYGLPQSIFNSHGVKQSKAAHGTYLLPMAYSAGSPAHPAYVAGHAAVAGACVTILKAWFQENQTILELMNSARTIDQPQALGIWQPAQHAPGGPLPAYFGADAGSMTVVGELNKLAANIAMGRSMGGVHFRTDNTRSLRLGEQVATIILKRLHPTYAEHERLTFTYTSFDNETVTIGGPILTHAGRPPSATVTIGTNLALENYYNTL